MNNNSNGLDKNALIGILLIGALLVIFNLFLFPSGKQNTPNTQTKTAADTTQNSLNAGGTVANNTATIQKNGAFVQDSSSAPKKYVLENEVLKVTFSSQGGKIETAELKKYNTYDQQPVQLLNDQNNLLDYSFYLKGAPVNTQNYNFEAQQPTPNTLIFRLKADSSAYVEQIYTLTNEANGYLLNYDVSFVGMQNVLQKGSVIDINLKANQTLQERSAKGERYYSALYYKEKDENPTYLSPNTNKTVEATIDWVGFQQQFFNTTLISKNGFKRAKLETQQPSEDGKIVQNCMATVGFEYTGSPKEQYNMQWFLGPNHYQTLSKLGQSTNKMVALGWGIFGWVNRFFIIPLFNLLSSFIGNYGVIILILTLLVKAILFPLSFRSFKSFAKLNLLRPEMEAIKAKYPDDAQRVQMETMRMYSQAGVNPLGGCLPQLLQFPILIAMYRFFPVSIELRQKPFLWANDLSSYDSILSLPFTIPAYGNHVSLFTLLAAATTFFTMRQTNAQQMTANTPEAALQMKMFQVISPLMILFFCNSLAAGLTWYILISNVLGFVQQYVMKKMLNTNALQTQINTNRVRPVQTKTKFQERLEEMVRQQQETAERKNNSK